MSLELDSACIRIVQEIRFRKGPLEIFVPDMVTSLPWVLGVKNTAFTFENL